MDNEFCDLFQASADLYDENTGEGGNGRCDLYQMGSGEDILADCSGPIIDGHHTVVPMPNNQYDDESPLTEAALAHDGWRCFGTEVT